MTLRTILHYPDNRLRQLCPDQTEYNNELKTLISDMFETMYHEKGIGLSAIQINVITRVITIDVSKDRNEKIILINPVSWIKENLSFLMRAVYLFLDSTKKSIDIIILNTKLMTLKVSCMRLKPQTC